MSMNSLLLCFKMIDSSTHNHSLTDLAMVEEIDLVESNLGRLEIKIHMVGVDDLDLNTRVGGSLSENWMGQVWNSSECFTCEWDVVEGYI